MITYEQIEALNWSSLKNMDVSPLLYQWRQEHPRPDTPALALGRAVHCAILEPERFAERYAVRPDGLDGRTREGKAWLAEAAESGVEVLTVEQGAVIAACSEAVARHAPSVDLLAATRREEVITWTDPASRVACKGRLDAIGPDRLIDVKTIRDLGRIERDAYEFRYHGQLAWYLDGAITAGILQPDAGVYLLAVETAEPYDCAAYVVPPYVLEAGRALYRRLLGTWLACRDTGLWPGRYPALAQLELPRWAQEHQEEEW